jgi:hypothetical protein
MDAGIISSIVTGAVAIIALLIQYRTYRRENSIQNENNFFSLQNGEIPGDYIKHF